MLQEAKDFHRVNCCNGQNKLLVRVFESIFYQSDNANISLGPPTTATTAAAATTTTTTSITSQPVDVVGKQTARR